MCDDPDAVMLFAAGFGTRMGDLTKARPKPLIKVAGRALLDHALTQIDGIPLSRKVVNCHYFPDQIETHLKTRPDISILHESGEVLETGGGLKNALHLLGEGPVFTMNSDAVWQGPNPLTLLKDAWNPKQMDALLLCVPRERAIGHKGKGDFVFDESNAITYGPGAIYSGLQIIKTNRLSEIAESAFSLKLLWEKILAEQRMFGVQYSGNWCDVGTPKGIDLAEEMLGYAHV